MRLQGILEYLGTVAADFAEFLDRFFPRNDTSLGLRLFLETLPASTVAILNRKHAFGLVLAEPANEECDKSHSASVARTELIFPDLMPWIVTGGETYLV